MTKDYAQFLRQQVADSISTHDLLRTGGRLYVGFSGGADSTALLLLMREFARQYVLPLEAVHLNHGIRGKAADRDAAWCRDFCTKRQIPFTCHDLNVQERMKRGENLEAAARRLRLQFWKEYSVEQAKSHSDRDNSVSTRSAVALGHHADDALEDLFLRLGRGSGTSGLTALRPQREIKGVHFIRPLLRVRRAAIQRFLEAEGITDWRRDLTNQDTRLRRNAIRHRLIPLIQDLWGNEAGFFQSLNALREDAAFLEEAAQQYSATKLTPKYFAAIPHALQPRVLRHWLSARLGTDFVPRYHALERLRQIIESPANTLHEVPVGNNVMLEVDRQHIELKRKIPCLSERTWKWRQQSELALPELDIVLQARMVPAPPATTLRKSGRDCEYFDPGEIPDTLTVRAPYPGDRMIPFGHSFPSKLKDVLNAAGLTPLERRRVPLVIAGKDILWAVGVRRSTLAKPPVLNSDSDSSKHSPAVQIRIQRGGGKTVITGTRGGEMRRA